MASQSQFDENEMFAKILRSMGVDEYDPNVLLAVNEMARQFATELLHDAHDYASHAGRSEILPEDITLAAKMCDTKTIGADPRLGVAPEVVAAVNSQDLSQLLDREGVLLRYPSLLSECLQQRNFTFIPGLEAYPEPLPALPASRAPVKEKTSVHDSVRINFPEKKRKLVSPSEFEDA